MSRSARTFSFLFTLTAIVFYESVSCLEDLTCPPGYLVRGQSVYNTEHYDKIQDMNDNFLLCIVCESESKLREDSLDICLPRDIFKDRRFTQLDLTSSFFTAGPPGYVYRIQFSFHAKEASYQERKLLTLARVKEDDAARAICGISFYSAAVNATLSELANLGQIIYCRIKYPPLMPFLNLLNMVVCPSHLRLSGIVQNIAPYYDENIVASCGLCSRPGSGNKAADVYVCRRNVRRPEADVSKLYYRCLDQPCEFGLQERRQPTVNSKDDCGYEINVTRQDVMSLVNSTRTVGCEMSERYSTTPESLVMEFRLDALHVVLLSICLVLTVSQAVVVLGGRRARKVMESVGCKIEQQKKENEITDEYVVQNTYYAGSYESVNEGST